MPGAGVAESPGNNGIYRQERPLFYIHPGVVKYFFGIVSETDGESALLYTVFHLPVPPHVPIAIPFAVLAY